MNCKKCINPSKWDQGSCSRADIHCACLISTEDISWKLVQVQWCIASSGTVHETWWDYCADILPPMTNFTLVTHQQQLINHFRKYFNMILNIFKQSSIYIFIEPHHAWWSGEGMKILRSLQWWGEMPTSSLQVSRLQ